MKRTLLLLLALLLASLACSSQSRVAPTPIPEGILVDEIPSNMDIIFDSIRYVLNDGACLDEGQEVDKNFINLPECNALIYDPGTNSLGSPRQLYAMNVDTLEIIQITNTDCFFALGQAISSTSLMTLAICQDTDENGILTEKDQAEIYILDLRSEEMSCLTCAHDLTSINNPDYSQVRRSVVFSSQHSSAFHNYLFSIDTNGHLIQLTNQSDFMDFDCSWSEDGTKIVFSRLPAPWFENPTQVWLMDADGTNQVKITNGGPNPHGEENQGSYPIGIDADPDLSPDNQKVVFSRLRTGKENFPFGIYELIVVDVETKELVVLDSQYANMIPHWKSGGILINRQVGGANTGQLKAMEMRQSLHIYIDGEFRELEEYPFNVFPLGAYGGYWIDLD
jgi:Tol biopolymer transport system component